MNLTLYNTLGRKEEKFKAINKNTVGFYSCGPTVYSSQHIGNMRAYIFADTLKRVLMFNGYKVNHIMNITDVGHLTSDADSGEDKIEKAAKKEKKTAKEITGKYIQEFKKDLKSLNIIYPSNFPKASSHVKEQIELIKKLEKKGFTYETPDGIYYDTSKFKDYNKLSGAKLEFQKGGKRVELREKKNKTDFALWKFSGKKGERQQEWNSPWGVGYPGWHLECSAMSMEYLGNHFDIHTGGQEHVQIHHSNEIAQSEASSGKKFVNYWLHNGWLTFKGEKVSRSKGGLYTIEELEELGFDPLAFRYLCLMTHYRKPLEFSLESLRAAQTSYDKLKDKVLEFKKGKKGKKSNKYEKEFLDAINDDLNTPKALGILWDFVKDERISDKYNTIIKFDEALGLGLKNLKEKKLDSGLMKLIKEREKARKEKDWKRSDEIREKLKKKGIQLKDENDGSTSWSFLK